MKPTINTKLDNDIRKYKILLNIQWKSLTKKESDFLNNYILKSSNFYRLLKLHKSEEIKVAIETQKSEYIVIRNARDHIFRPIVAGPSCPTKRLKKQIDILRQLFLNKIKSCIRDDIHFLSSISQKKKTDLSTIMVIFDVTNLYSNNPHELGKQAISFWIEKYPETLHPRFNEKIISDGIELI